MDDPVHRRHQAQGRSSPQAGSHPAMRVQRHRAKVTIVGAKGLRAADTGLFSAGKSDPYVQCMIEGRPHSMFKTSTIKKELNPTWNHEQIMDSIKTSDRLEFKVFDHDLIGSNDLLGTAHLDFSDFYPNGWDAALTLSDTGAAVSNLQIKVEMLPPLPQARAATRCFVRIVSAHNLRGADFGGKSDPFAICEIKGKPKSKIQTKVIYKTLEPVWQEEDEIQGYAEGDNLEFTVYDWDLVGSNDVLGQATLMGPMFHGEKPPFSWEGTLSLAVKGRPSDATLRVGVDVSAPPKVRTKPTDPGQHVTIEHRQRVPFHIRSLETNHIHKLMGFTQIGRSRKKMDPEIDLLISDMSADVSGVHAVIKAWQLSDNNSFHIRVYDRKGGGGFQQGPGGGNAAGGTSVDGVAVDPDVGNQIYPGSIIRFGVNELWVVEACALHTRSGASVGAQGRAVVNEMGDASAIRELQVPSFACHHALHSCEDWISIVRVALEWLDDPDEPACVDEIEVLDELKRTASVHRLSTFEEMQSYPIKSILEDIRLGTTLRLRLCSDPYLLAPVIMYLEDLRKWLADLEEARDDIPD